MPPATGVVGDGRRAGRTKESARRKPERLRAKGAPPPRCGAEPAEKARKSSHRRLEGVPRRARRSKVESGGVNVPAEAEARKPAPPRPILQRLSAVKMVWAKCRKEVNDRHREGRTSALSVRSARGRCGRGIRHGKSDGVAEKPRGSSAHSRSKKRSATRCKQSAAVTQRVRHGCRKRVTTLEGRTSAQNVPSLTPLCLALLTRVALRLVNKAGSISIPTPRARTLFRGDGIRPSQTEIVNKVLGPLQQVHSARTDGHRRWLVANVLSGSYPSQRHGIPGKRHHEH